MVSPKRDLTVAPYSFEPEYSEGNESFDTSSDEEFESSDKKVFRRLLNLE